MELHRLEQVAERLGMARRRLVEDAKHLEGGLLVVALAGERRQPQRAHAAEELPDGIGWSSRLRGRTISASWSAEVSKKPPVGSSRKRSIDRVGERARASMNQRVSNVAS